MQETVQMVQLLIHLAILGFFWRTEISGCFIIFCLYVHPCSRLSFILRIHPNTLQQTLYVELITTDKYILFASSNMLSHLLGHLAALTSLLVICFYVMVQSIHVYSLMLNMDFCGALYASASNMPPKGILKLYLLKLSDRHSSGLGSGSILKSWNPGAFW